MTAIPDSPGVRFCWCPPMNNPDDPAQHEAACAHAAFVEQWQARRSAAETGIRLCFCASVDDPADPEQHQIGCLHAEALRTHATRQRLSATAEDMRTALWGPNRRSVPTAIPSRCYKASFGWVHVKPGCHCTR